MNMTKHINLCKAKNIRLTKKRYKILEVILSCHHFTSAELHKKVKSKINIGVATTYRTIKVFEAGGIISKRIDKNNVSYYELKDDSKHNHHHLICNSCNKIFDMRDDLLEEIEKIVSEKYKFKILNHNVDFYGRCKECNDKTT